MNGTESNRDPDRDPSLVYRSLEPTIKRCLVSLSRLGWLYLGRYGYGFTKKLRREAERYGTIVTIDRLAKEYGLRQDSMLVRSFIQTLVIEGSFFCLYSKALKDYFNPENPVVSDAEILKPEPS